MKSKPNSDAGASPRTLLVVEADGARAEELRAELAARGFAVSVLRSRSEEEPAGLSSGRDPATPLSGSGDGADAAFTKEGIQILFRNLTSSENKVLEILLRNAGMPVSRTDLYRELYNGQGPVESRAIDQLLRRLKDKLGSLGESIETRRGVGVRWNTERKNPTGLSPRRLLEILRACRAAVLSLFLVVGFAAGWLLRPGADGQERAEPGAHSGCEAEQLFPSPPPPAEALLSTEGMAAAAGHGPECAIDGNTNTWFQTLGPARKRDLVQVLYRPNVRGRLSVRCGVPGSTNALPQVRVGVQYADDEQRRLGFVDPATGAFSRDLEKPVYKVFVAVADDSDEPFAVRSVRIDP